MKKFFFLLFLLFNFFNLYSQTVTTKKFNNILQQNTIKKFSFPLPEKYKNKSSIQGLRKEINVEEIGASTSGKWHNGIDFPCPEGTPVYASKDGIITCVYPGYYNGEKFKGHEIYGGLVIIKHYDNTISLYAHLSVTYVTEGQKVKIKEKIGESGGVKGKRASGVSTGPHLHFSMYLDIEEMLIF